MLALTLPDGSIREVAEGTPAKAVVATIGTGLLVGSIIRDQPRQQDVKAVKQERRAFIKAVNESHRQAPLEVPLTTLMTF